MILLIDNYDSFSYNLYQMIGTLDPDIQVIRNDAMSVEEIASLGMQAIIISQVLEPVRMRASLSTLLSSLDQRFPLLESAWDIKPSRLHSVLRSPTQKHSTMGNSQPVCWILPPPPLSQFKTAREGRPIPLPER